LQNHALSCQRALKTSHVTTHLKAAEAALSGDRTQFDLHVDPTQLGIRSEAKPFEFRNPPGVEI